MGLNQRWSNTVEGKELAYLLVAFEELNSCTLSISCVATKRERSVDLLMTLSATTNHPVLVERVPLASVGYTLSQLNCKTIEAATISLLYKLDSQLARLEMGRAPL